MKKIIFILFFIVNSSYAEWTMFSSGNDDYMYNTSTGETFRFYRTTNEKGEITDEGFTQITYTFLYPNKGFKDIITYAANTPKAVSDKKREIDKINDKIRSKKK